MLDETGHKIWKGEGGGWQGEQTALLPLPAMGSVCVCEAERLQAVFMCSAEVSRARDNYCVCYTEQLTPKA